MFFKKKIPIEQIIEGCVKNERKFQQAMYDQYFDVMLMVCRKYTRDENDILSLVNDAFLKVFKNISNYQNTGSFEGWLKKIMYHTIVDHFRYKDKKLGFLEFADILPEVSSRENALDTLILSEIFNLFEGLPVNSAKALQLFALEGYSHADIAKELDMSEGTSRWHVSQARNLLKEKLKSYYNDDIKTSWS